MIMAVQALILPLIILLFAGSSLSESAIIGNDHLALLEFKRQIINDPYGALSSWNDSVHFCNWVGITCGRLHQQRVIRLKLKGKGLAGSISPSIGNLTFMRFLDIGDNSFYGQIPQQVGNLFRLQFISFENNTLQGKLPLSLANCTRLRRIYLSNNYLVGEIPAEVITSWTKLEIVSINNNGLTGEIPAFLGNISSIQIISLGTNKLQGSIPESFGQLTNLYGLALHQNSLSGIIPLSLYNLSSLEVISLAYNQFYGSLPQDIGLTLPNLIDLEIGMNLFSGMIPESISNISMLEIISFPGNNFVGPVPTKLGALQSLQIFVIEENKFGTGKAGDLDFINLLLNCTRLEKLGLGSNGFKGPLPNLKANLSTQLWVIDLGMNQISGTIPAGIENLINLTSLSMEYNFFEGDIPSSIGNLPKLERLLLGENKLSGKVPSFIGNLTHLYELDLHSNNFNANIPSSIGKCQWLQVLNLFENNLQGPIPKQLFSIPTLIALNLSKNSLVGSLPIEIGNVKSLSTIDISENKLFGEIPSSIGDCNSLEHLYMRGNFFEGTIPQSLTLLKGLQNLDLSNNNLSGQIPKDLEKLSALQSLNLSFNNLEGEVPRKGIFGNATSILVKGNVKLCGGIVELQLPVCVSHGSKKQKKSFRIIVVTISLVICLLLISSFLTLYWMRRSKSKLPSNPLIGDQFFKISYRELFQATGGFSSSNCIGFGSFGSVYKGILFQDETIVAIKVFNLQNPRVYKSFLVECKALKNIRHRNLVKILTSCSSLDSKGKDFKALVYEYMPNGSLNDWLHPPTEIQKNSKSLSLLQRLNSAIDVASALDYLHYRCDVPIVHCDLKPSNVLLDIDMTAHVSDFGLARLLLELDDNSSESQTITIGIKGSIGYAAPEYGMGGEASVQADTFSFGILLLEMFTGKKPTDQMFIDDWNLHKFAKASLTGHVIQILDPTLLPNENQSGETKEDAFTRANGPDQLIDKLQNCVIPIVEIAVRCSMELPRERMSMNNVVKELHSIKKKYF